MQTVLNDLKRNVYLEKIFISRIAENSLDILVKSWHHTLNGSIDEYALAQTIRDVLGTESGLEVNVYRYGEEWANVYICRINTVVG